MTVLVAEDNQTNIEVLTSMLEMLEYTFVVAEDGARVVEIASERDDIQLVLMDVQMPKMDGYSATREIRRREQESGRVRVPIVALTGRVLEADRLAAVECGMDGFLTKPIDLDELEVMLATRCLPATERESRRDPDAVLDEAVVARFCAQGMWSRAVEAFTQDLDRGSKMIREAMRNADTEALTRAAHFLRGSAATMGANRAAHRAELLEDADDQERATCVEQLLVTLEETRAAMARVTGGS